MAEAVVGSVSVDVVPNAEQFWRRFKAATQNSATPTGADLGEDLGKALGDVAGPEARERLERALTAMHGSVDLDTAKASAKIEELQLQVDRLGRGGGSGGGVGRDLGGIGAGAQGAAGSINGALIPALLAASTLVGPLVAVGAAGLGTLALGFAGLKDQVQTELTPAFHELESVATNALRPGIGAALGQLQQAIPQLQPLLQVFGDEIGKVAKDLATWLNNGGLEGFVQYAERELPIVEGALIALTKAGVGFFNAVTPLGNGLLDVLTKVANAFSTIAGFAGQLEGGASSGGASSGARSSFGSQLGYAFSSSGGYAPKPKTTGDYFSGIGHDIFTFLDSEGQPSQTKKAAGPYVAPAANLNAKGVPLSALDSGQSAASAAQASALEKNAAAYNATTAAYQLASTSSANFAAQTEATTVQMQMENNATGLLSQALNGLNGDNLGVAQATTQFQTGLQTLGATLSKNSDTIDGNSAAALANQTALQTQVAAAQAIYQATVKQTGSTEQGKAAYDQAITSIENATGATGKQKDAINAYVEQIGKIPPVKMTQLDIDDATALDSLSTVQQKLDAISKGVSATVLINIAASLDQSTGSSAAFTRAEFSGHAAGGMVDDGFFMTGEQGIEYGYKSGSNVQIFNHADTMAMSPSAASGPQTVQVTSYTVLDGNVLATSVSEHQMQNARR